MRNRVPERALSKSAHSKLSFSSLHPSLKGNPRPTQSSPQCLHLNLTNFFYSSTSSSSYPCQRTSPQHPYCIAYLQYTTTASSLCPEPSEQHILNRPSTFYTLAAEIHLLAAHSRKKTQGTYSTLSPPHLGSLDLLSSQSALSGHFSRTLYLQPLRHSSALPCALTRPPSRVIIIPSLPTSSPNLIGCHSRRSFVPLNLDSADVCRPSLN